MERDMENPKISEYTWWKAELHSLCISFIHLNFMKLSLLNLISQWLFFVKEKIQLWRRKGQERFYDVMWCDVMWCVKRDKSQQQKGNQKHDKLIIIWPLLISFLFFSSLSISPCYFHFDSSTQSLFRSKINSHQYVLSY